MHKNSTLLSIGAALFFSLFFFGVGHAFQIDRNQDARILMAGHMKGTATLSIKQVSNTPNPCTEGGLGRTGAPGKQRCPLGSGAMATAGSLSTNQVSNACGGRTGATCREHSQPGSAAMATRWVSRYKSNVGSKYAVRRWYHRAGRSWRQKVATPSRASRVDDKKIPLNQGLVPQ